MVEVHNKLLLRFPIKKQNICLNLFILVLLRKFKHESKKNNEIASPAARCENPDAYSACPRPNPPLCKIKINCQKKHHDISDES